jgi:hypothetical protein
VALHPFATTRQGLAMVYWLSLIALIERQGL